MKTRLVRIRFTQEMFIEILGETFPNLELPKDLSIQNANVDVLDRCINLVLDSKEFREEDLHEGGYIRVARAYDLFKDKPHD